VELVPALPDFLAAGTCLHQALERMARPERWAVPERLVEQRVTPELVE
jgi:hypothetical protein